MATSSGVIAAADELPGIEFVDAIEVYNHNATMATIPDRANGGYMLGAYCRITIVDTAARCTWSNSIWP
jgi:hypothetical protein